MKTYAASGCYLKWMLPCLIYFEYMDHPFWEDFFNKIKSMKDDSWQSDAFELFWGISSYRSTLRESGEIFRVDSRLKLECDFANRKIKNISIERGSVKYSTSSDLVVKPITLIEMLSALKFYWLLDSEYYVELFKLIREEKNLYWKREAYIILLNVPKKVNDSQIYCDFNMDTRMIDELIIVKNGVRYGL